MALGAGRSDFVALSLANFTMTDPAWSRSVAASDEAVRNLSGLFGAYLADVGYYLFGLSVWWWVIAACVFLYKNFRPLHNDEQKTYNTTIAAIRPAGALNLQPDSGSVCL